MRKTGWFVVVTVVIGCSGGSSLTDAGGPDGDVVDASKDSGNDAPLFQDAPSSDAADASSGTTYSSLTDQSKWSTFDLRTVTNGARGFVGTAFDGRYVYFVPSFNGSADGLVGRYDTTASFTTATSWATFDMATVNAGLVGFSGAAFDGRYVYFVPASGGRVGCYDTQAPFNASASWSSFDVTTVNGGSTGYSGAVFDGQYVYFVPYYGTGPNTVVARYNTLANFVTATSWSTFDIKTANAGAFGSIGAVFDGRYVYLVPYFNGGEPVWRYDTQAAFTTSGSWSSFDITTVSQGVPGYRGAVFDGQHVYFVPYNDGTVLRFDTKANFTTAGSWSTFDVATVSSGAQSFFGGAFDGRNIYFAPSGGIVGRYDTQATFNAAPSWSTFDMTVVNAGADGGGAGTGGLEGAAFDGRYVYFAPTTSGLVVRFDAKTPPALPPGPAHGSFF